MGAAVVVSVGLILGVGWPAAATPPSSAPSPAASSSTESPSSPVVPVPGGPAGAGGPAADHLQPKDLGAARRELRGEVVARKADGTPWNHVAEVMDAQRGLLKRIGSIRYEMRLGHRMTVDQRANLQLKLSYASRMLDYSYKYVPTRGI